MSFPGVSPIPPQASPSASMMKFRRGVCSATLLIHARASSTRYGFGKASRRFSHTLRLFPHVARDVASSGAGPRRMQRLVTIFITIFWSGRRESNPHCLLGRQTHYHYATPAILVGRAGFEPAYSVSWTDLQSVAFNHSATYPYTGAPGYDAFRGESCAAIVPSHPTPVGGRYVAVALSLESRPSSRSIRSGHVFMCSLPGSIRSSSSLNCFRSPGFCGPSWSRR